MGLGKQNAVREHSFIKLDKSKNINLTTNIKILITFMRGRVAKKQTRKRFKLQFMRVIRSKVGIRQKNQSFLENIIRFNMKKFLIKRFTCKNLST